MHLVKKVTNPPTPEDAKMRVAHVADSVDYNLRHAHDHAMATVEQVAKLKKVAPKVAKKQANKAHIEFEEMVQKLHKGLKGAISDKKLDQSSAQETTKGY